VLREVATGQRVACHFPLVEARPAAPANVASQQSA
jgi:hypothetical protein